MRPRSKKTKNQNNNCNTDSNQNGAAKCKQSGPCGVSHVSNVGSVSGFNTDRSRLSGTNSGTNKGWWNFDSDDKGKEFELCDSDISDKLNRLSIGSTIYYSINGNEYVAKKKSPVTAVRMDLSTKQFSIIRFENVTSGISEWNDYDYSCGNDSKDKGKKCWYVENNNNTIEQSGDIIDWKLKYDKCSPKLQLQLSTLKIGHSTKYKIGKWNYKATKVTKNLISQKNESTKTVRALVYRYESENINDDDDTKMKMKILFHNTMKTSDYEILKIKKIDFDAPTKQTQLNLYTQLLKDKMKTANNNNNNNNNNVERYLFHGTSYDIIEKIVHNGFNRDFNKNAVYGKGVYFAKNAKCSHDYCTANKNGKYHMLICRVIVGDYCKGTSDMQTIPFKSDGITQYDSLVNNVSNPKIFVISRDYHCIPYYLVKYRKIEKKQTTLAAHSHRRQKIANFSNSYSSNNKHIYNYINSNLSNKTNSSYYHSNSFTNSNVSTNTSTNTKTSTRIDTTLRSNSLVSTNATAAATSSTSKNLKSVSSSTSSAIGDHTSAKSNSARHGDVTSQKQSPGSSNKRGCIIM